MYEPVPTVNQATMEMTSAENEANRNLAAGAARYATTTAKNEPLSPAAAKYHSSVYAEAAAPAVPPTTCPPTTAKHATTHERTETLPMASNAALSGRGATTFQETSKTLPAVRLNA